MSYQKKETELMVNRIVAKLIEDSDIETICYCPEEETYGGDILCFKFWDFEPYKTIEVKSFAEEHKVDFKKWRGNNYGNPCEYCFDFTPDISISANDLAKVNFQPATQSTLNAWKEKQSYTEDWRRWFFITAATNNPTNNIPVITDDIDWVNMENSDKIKFYPKWYKMINSPTYPLTIKFNDGVVVFNQQQLKDALVSYGYAFKKKQNSDPKGTEFWQFKAFIDIDQGTFIKWGEVSDYLRK